MKPSLAEVRKAMEAELTVARRWLEESKANALCAEDQIRELRGRLMNLAEPPKALETVLKAVREARDTAPAEWDALMASCAGPALTSAWDEVKAALGEAKR